MSAKIIVSYDGTANEDDAIALGRIFARAGAEVSLAYVRHTHEPDRDRETLVEHEAQALLERGVEQLGIPSAGKHVVTDRSTPEGLRALAEQTGADVIVFCSDSHTAKGHIAVGNSAERLLEGGRTAIAIAPVGLAETARSRACCGSSRSATATAVPRRPPRPSPARSERPLTLSSTRKPTCWWWTRVPRPSGVGSRSAPRPRTWSRSPTPRCSSCPAV